MGDARLPAGGKSCRPYATFCATFSLLAGLSSGCYLGAPEGDRLPQLSGGAADSGDNADGVDSDGVDSDGVDSDGGDSDGGDDTSGSEGESAPRTLPTRRLTRHQYNNTVADLLGDTTDPASLLSPDAQAYGFKSNGEGDVIALLSAEQYEIAADDISARAITDLPNLMGCDLGGDEASCVASFVANFGRRAFRRPLSADEQARFIAFYDEQRSDREASDAVRLVLKAFLMSPKFLYRLEPGEPDAPVDDWVMASRLSYLLWNTMPDEELFGAVESGGLATAEGVEEQARRMLDDTRAQAVILDFHGQWLHLDRVTSAAKDSNLYPEYTESIQEAMLAETEMFIVTTLLHGDGSLHTLLTAPYSYLNDQLANYYGIVPPGMGDEVFAQVQLDPARSAGLLTHGSFLAAHSTSTSTSPVRRGKFVREQLLCGEVPTPPAGLDVTPPEPTLDSTTRERYAQHSEDPVCATCHVMMDPIGFGFEHYDTIGRWRDDENGLQIDPSVVLSHVDEQTDGEYADAVDLAVALADSEATRDCIARQWFRFGYGRNDSNDSFAEDIDWLISDFAANEGNIKELIVALTQSDLFLGGR